VCFFISKAPNLNHSFWMDTLKFCDKFSEALHVHGVQTSVDIMCNANVTSPVLCQNGLPYFNNSATTEVPLCVPWRAICEGLTVLLLCAVCVCGGYR